ncbi:MAG: ABC transporter ATP-binding protein [Rickettsiales bacterium]|nr:ABC transporter ATP-binding protein [Rickettsiales bacterium]
MMKKVDKVKLPSNVLSLILYMIRDNFLYFLIYFILHGFLADLPFAIIMPLSIRYITDNIVKISIPNGVAIMLMLAFLNGSFVHIIMYFFKYISVTKSSEKLRALVFKYVVRQSNDYFNNNFSGALGKKISNIIDNIGDFIELSVELTRNLIYLTINIVILAVTHYALGLIVVVWLPIYIYCVWLLSKKINDLSKISNDKEDTFFAFITDDFINISNVKNFTNEEYEYKKLVGLGEDVKEANWKMCKVRNILSLFNFFAIGIFMVVVLGMSMNMCIKGNMTVGTFLFIMSMMGATADNQSHIVPISRMMFEEYGAIRDGLVLMERDCEIKDGVDAKDVNNVEGKIVFKNVDFKY